MAELKKNDILLTINTTDRTNMQLYIQLHLLRGKKNCVYPRVKLPHWNWVGGVGAGGGEVDTMTGGTPNVEINESIP